MEKPFIHHQDILGMRGSDDKTGSLHVSLQSYCSMRHGSKGFLAGITTVTQQSGPFPLRLKGGELSQPEENRCLFLSKFM